MRRVTAVVTMVARCRFDYVHVLTEDSAVTRAQLCHHSSCLPWQGLFGCSNGRRSAINQFWKAAFNGSSDRILVYAADGRLVAGIVEWLFAGYCWMLGLSRPIRDRHRSGRSSGGLWQSWWQGCCGRWHAKANCWEIRSLCCRTISSRASWCSSAKSTILRQPVTFLSAEFCARCSRLQLVSQCDGVLSRQQ